MGRVCAGGANGGGRGGEVDGAGRKGLVGGTTACELCAEETENLEHFLLWCLEYQREGSDNKKIQRPFKEEVEEVMGELLFEENIEEAKE